MNKRKQQSPLRDLPQPASPAGLDQKILHHARAQAPAKPNLWRSPWVGGLVTASIVTVALLIADPSVQVPESGPAAILMEDHAARKEVRQINAPSSHYEAGVAADLQRNEATLNAEPTAATSAHAIAAPAPQPELPAKAKQASPPAASMAAASEQRAALTDKRRDRSLRQQQANVAARKEQDMAEVMAGAAMPMLSKQSGLKQEMEEKDDLEFAAVPPVRATLGLQLRSLQELFASGEEDTARMHYKTLRDSCPECDLPATLEEAFAQFEKQDASKAK